MKQADLKEPVSSADPLPKSSGWVSALKGIIFMAVALAILAPVLLLVAEAVARVTEPESFRTKRIFYDRYVQGFPDREQHLFQFHPVLGWTPNRGVTVPHTNRGWVGQFKIDAEGMRVLEGIPPNGTEGSPTRVMLIGDSMGFGMGAHDDETIDRFLLERSPGIALKNASAPGWSPEQYHQSYFHFKDKFKPTHVYMLITVINDFYALHNCVAYGRFKPTVRLTADGDDRVLSPVELMKFRPAGESILWDSRLLYRVGAALEPAYLKRLSGLEDPYDFLGTTEDRDRLEYFSKSINQTGKYDFIWRRFEFILSEMRKDATENGIKFSVIVLPLRDLREFVDREKAEKSLPADFELKPAGDQSNEVIVDYVRRAGDKAGVPVYYPIEAFHDAKARGINVWSQEGHYGPEGNRLIADFISENLKS